MRPAAPSCSGRFDASGARSEPASEARSAGAAGAESRRWANGVTNLTRILGDHWLLPALDAKNRAWFTSGQLALQACARCEAVQFPPEDACRSCGSFELAARASAGLGRVESVAVVHHAVHPLLRPHVPYAVVLVALDDAPGVNLLGNVLNRPADRIAIGERVRVAFEEVRDPDTGETLRIPQWEVVT